MSFLPSKLNEFKIIRTCDFAPEQYDVYDINNKQIAYIRERHDYLSVECPDCGGKVVFETELSSKKPDVNSFQDEIFEAIYVWYQENKEDKANENN